MTFNPTRIIEVRKLFQKYIPTLSNVELGIAGDASHGRTGNSYHLGEDALKSSSYTIVESSRDRNGLSEAASALDIGQFTIKTRKGSFDLADLSVWLVAECKANAPDTRDIREIIYSPDGKVVKRFDDLGIRSSGDDSHLFHTHISWYRDSEQRDKTAVFKRWFVHIGAIEGDEVTPEDLNKIRAIVKEEVGASIDDFLNVKIGDAANPDRRVGDVLRDVAKLRGYLIGDEKDTKNAAIAATAPVARLIAAVGAIADLENAIDEFAGAPVSEEMLLKALRTVIREGVGE